MKNRKITYLLLSGIMATQISSNSLAFCNFKCLRKKVENKVKAFIYGSKAVKKKPPLFKNLFKKMRTPKGACISLAVTAVASILAYGIYKVVPKIYYTGKLYKAYKNDNRNDIEVFKRKLNCPIIDNAFSGGNILHWFTGL